MVQSIRAKAAEKPRGSPCLHIGTGLAPLLVGSGIRPALTVRIPSELAQERRFTHAAVGRTGDHADEQSCRTH
jgi:hypothetical protein